MSREEHAVLLMMAIAAVLIAILIYILLLMTRGERAMREIYGELWSYFGKLNTIVLVTTNGVVTKDGRCVMGRGCALEAKNRFPGIDIELAKKITAGGNVMHSLQGGLIYSFPVKHDWKEQADLNLIAKSTYRLSELALERSTETFILPRPGCGNGRLCWEDVKSVIGWLPDNVWVITK